MVVYETEKGALCVAIPVEIMGSEVAWRGKHTATLAKQDGTLMARGIQDLKTIFGWDGIDPFALQDIEVGAHEFEIVGEHQEYTPPGDDAQPVMTFKIVFMNPPGGSSKMPAMLEGNDAKAIRTKYASKFKALSGGKSAPATAAKKPTAKVEEDEPELPAKKSAPAKPASSGPPSRKSTGAVSRTSTQEEVWTAFAAAHEGEDEAELGKQYWEAVEEVAPDANGELTIQQWGEVAVKLEV
jgi:hypothetical protein